MENGAIYYGYYDSPIGWVQLGCAGMKVVSLQFLSSAPEGSSSSYPYVEEALRQISEYFERRRQTFTLEVDLNGTPFQQEVWQQLQSVQYGITASYQSIADAIGRPKAVRAVGTANGSNPIGIIVPCHRIIGTRGELTGYAGGMWRKEWLLKHEGALLL